MLPVDYGLDMHCLGVATIGEAQCPVGSYFGHFFLANRAGALYLYTIGVITRL
jgi:hypothetical protein